MSGNPPIEPLRAGLSPERRALLDQWLAGCRRGTPPAGGITPRPVGMTEVPLSFAQERLWFLQQLDPASPVYNVPGNIWLRAPIDPRLLERAVNEVVHRHEVLRTRFALRGGRPHQVVEPALHVPLPLTDLSALPVEEGFRRAAEIARKEARRPFDLGTGPLVRTHLLRLGPAEHVLLLTLHHIVCDGWSMGLLNRELSAVFRGLETGLPAELAPLPVQYADFAVWQRQWLQGDTLQALVSYWRGALAGAPTLLRLPADAPAPATRTFRGASRSLTLSAPLTAALRELSRSHGCTPFMTLLAAIGLLLSRLSGQDDVLVGTPIAGRNRRSTEGLIGFFINTLVIRLRYDPRLAFAQFLAQVRDTTLGAYAHQDLPFEKLLEELNPGRTPGRNPLFQVFFNMLNYGETSLDLPGVVDSAPAGEPPDDAEPEEALAKFDLTVYVEETEDRYRVRAVYSMDLFSDERMRELLRQYECLLEQAAAHPGDPVSRYSLVTAVARRVLPDPAEPLPAAAQPPLSTLLARGITGRSGVPAVVGWGGSWSWSDLDRRSGGLAAALREAGVGRGDVVAVCGPRSGALVCAMLGVHRAGAALLMLDPAYPAARLASFVDHAGATAWIGVPAPDAPTLAAYLAARPLKLRLMLADPAEWERLPVRPAPVPEETADPAYVAFTSGTTATPRAISGAEAPLSHFVRWHAGTFGLGSGDRFSMLSGLSHDPLLRDVFTPLALGATLCIPSPDERLRPAAFLRAHGVTVAHLTPALGRLMVEEGIALPALRYLFFGGDTLTVALVQRLRAQVPSATIVNFYGTTETPQAMAWHVVEEEDGRAADGRIPVGRGIDRAQLLLQSAPGVQAGIGELGEVAVRSPYLARGYLHEPELTARLFPSSPFSHDAADRLFHTGDLGRYTPAGEVVLAGRADHQLSVRGFRVDPREVEAVLERHPGVRQAVASQESDALGEQRLVAFVVPVEERGVAAGEVQEFVRAHLPDYMVPSAVVALDALPLTPNGKVDRACLPPVPAAPAGTGHGEVQPRTDTERALARIWCEVLARTQVSASDTFFELGGHSLLGVRMLSRVRDAFYVELPLQALFDHPTITALARVIETAGPERDLIPPVRPIQRVRYARPTPGE